MEAKITDLNNFIEDYNNLTPWDKMAFFEKVEDDIPTRKFEEYEFSSSDIFPTIDPYEYMDYYGFDNILYEIGYDYIQEYLDNNYGKSDNE